MELLYHYLWKSVTTGRLFRSDAGEEIEVVSPGIHNTDSGPDFFNSKIKVNGVEWVGNVEIHVKASDWYRHGHNADAAYNSVILHVVGESDTNVFRTDGSLIIQVKLAVPPDIAATFGKLSHCMDNIRCGSDLNSIPQITKTDWLETLSIERIASKALKVEEIYRSVDGDWQQTCFIILARALGFGLNGDPFEILARSLPLRILHHHSDNPLQLQALLFGEAGMLDASLHFNDSFYQSLCSEYYFLARKYGLSPMKAVMWKYARTRPQNFPHRRIAWLAKMCEGGFSLFSKILSSKLDPETFRLLFATKMDGYWENHISFGDNAHASPKALSKASIDSLIINVVVPLLYSYARFSGDYERAELTMNMLAKIPAEENGIIRQWKLHGIPATDAARTQALIHLRKNYCDAGKCIFCRFGISLLSNQNKSIHQNATSTTS